MVSVAVSVCTYCRPSGLHKLLLSLERITTSEPIRVIVADNDPDRQEGLEICRGLRENGYKWPLAAFAVAARGLPNARNAVIDRAFSDPAIEFVALLDDDESVEPGWLRALLTMQRQTGADIVGGAVIPEFESEPPSWMLKNKAYVRDDSTNGPVDKLYGDGNTLFARGVLRLVQPPFFDPAFSFTGGHDTFFFERAKSAGVTFARASQARVLEHYPTARMTAKWMVRRAYRTGANAIAIQKRLSPGASRWTAEIFKIMAALFVSSIELVVCFPFTTRRYNAMWLLARAFGKIGGLFGHSYEEYRGSASGSHSGH